MGTYSIHMQRSLFSSVSTEVTERQQQQCPGLTRKRFAANELIHQQKRAGTRGWWGEGESGGRWRETAGWSRGRAERLTVKFDGRDISMLFVTFSCPFGFCRTNALTLLCPCPVRPRHPSKKQWHLRTSICDYVNHTQLSIYSLEMLLLL